MKKIVLSIIMIAFLAFGYAVNGGNKDNNANNTPASTVTVSGSVVDFNTGEALTGVEISLEGTDQKVYSDFDGYFSFKNITPGEYNVVASFISYKNSLIENIDVSQTNDVSIKLKAD